MSKEKGEKKTVALTVVKVASTPRLFGDNGKAFLITTDEEQLEGDSYPFKLEVYQEDAVQPLKALIGQGPKEMTLAYVSSYPKEGENVVHTLRTLADAYKGRPQYLDRYSETALRRVWGAARLSWWLTMLLHRFPDEAPFDQRTRENQFDYLLASEHAQGSLAEQYVGLPFDN